MTDTTQEAVAREGVIMRDALQKIANSDRHTRCREIAWQALAALPPAPWTPAEISDTLHYWEKGGEVLKPFAAEGWVMVPREPTQAMLDALEDGTAWDESGWIGYNAREAYLAMLAAATAPRDTEPKP